MQATIKRGKFSIVFLVLLPVVALLVIFLYEDYTTAAQEVYNIIHAYESNHEVLEKLNYIINPFHNSTLQVILLLFILLILGYIRLFYLYRQRDESFLDPSTKVFNRRYYNEVVNTLNPKLYQLLVLRIENFNSIKHRHDEKITDIIVKAVVHRILRITRSHDIFIRFEEDTFVIFYKRKKDAKADILANRILEVITSQPIVAEGLYIQANIKIAINTQPQLHANLQEAIDKTKEDLHKVEKNNFVSSHNGSVNSSKKSRTIFELQEAIKHKHITPVFQPIYDAQSMRIVRYELFARILSPNKEVIKAKHFIQLVTGEAIHVELDITMLQHAVALIQEYAIILHLNVHVNTLCHDTMKQSIDTLLKDNAALASQLCIEINGLHEQQIYTKEAIKQYITHLKALGITVALDNFNLESIDFKDLLYCNPDILKLDATSIENDTYNILSLCQKMNIQTVIKTIQSEEELLSAQKSGANYLQGYFLAEPDFKIKEN